MNIPSTSASAAAISQQFCVRWNSHLGSLGAAFPQLLAGQRFVDVTLACEGHQVHCHRLVLAACSTYFESLLGENPCKHPIIILPRDIRLWEIQALVDFMYKGEVNVSQAGLTDLLKCAEILQIRGLCGTDAALNLNQLTQMGIGSSNITKMPTAYVTPNHSSNTNLNLHLNSTNLDCATTNSSKINNTLLSTVMAADLPQPSLLSTALTATTSLSGMSLVQNILNKTSANTSFQPSTSMTNTHPSTNETNSTTNQSNLLTTQSGESSQTVPINILSTAITTTETTGRRRSERKSNHQQKIDENDHLILDSSNDDLDIKCEDLIIGKCC
jgi:BTB/POZ domain